MCICSLIQKISLGTDYTLGIEGKVVSSTEKPTVQGRRQAIYSKNYENSHTPVRVLQGIFSQVMIRNTKGSMYKDASHDPIYNGKTWKSLQTQY